MRTPFVAGNWKLNLDRQGAVQLAAAVREHCEGAGLGVDVDLFPPAFYLDEVVRTCAGSPLLVGGQNCCEEASGAFTGETSAAMLADVGASEVLIGHSERRHVYGERDETLHAKVLQALDAGLAVMLCIGETIAEREAVQTEEVCGRQLSSALAGIAPERLTRLSIAYEPVWAIGTGLTASPDQAQAVHAYVRGLYAGLVGEDGAAAVRILYGGSVKPDNARDLLSQPDIDGALVGGASLKPELFLPIIDAGKS
ncbi:MAG: triose-phosphate isomerase [Planctomycetota bacterium]|nr:triose-phosphate isomerase [Planctomycetota bacterium]